MKIGAEDKNKLRALGVLVVIMIGSVYYSFFMDNGTSHAPAPAPAAGGPAAEIAPGPTAAPSVGSAPSTRPRPIISSRGASRNDEFHPTLRPRREEERVDPRTIDPTLHLELLAKVQDVKLDGGQRNLFQYGAAPPVQVAGLKGPEPTVVPKMRPPMGPPEYHPPPPPPAHVDPPPPPFTPKYYGLATKRINGKKTAFFLDGEEIILATEGMTVKKRYKLMKITPNSVVVQEMESKKDQTIPISEDAGGAASQS